MGKRAGARRVGDTLAAPGPLASSLKRRREGGRDAGSARAREDREAGLIGVNSRVDTTVMRLAQRASRRTGEPRRRPEVRKRNATPHVIRGALLRYVTYEENLLQMFPGGGKHLSASVRNALIRSKPDGHRRM